MEFDPITFVLEIVNFLVLVWLLKHFFYQPVLSVIEKRQSSTEQIIDDAKKIQQDAESLKNKYESRLSDFDKEHETAKSKIDEEIAVQRNKRLESLEKEIALERKRRKAIENREQNEVKKVLEQKAISLGARFASHLLERLSGPELNVKLVDMAVMELESLNGDEKEALYSALNGSEVNIEVVSAYPLDKLQRTSVADALNRIAEYSLVPEFSEDSTLHAGIYIKIGSWVLSANIRDELSFFGRNFGHES